MHCILSGIATLAAVFAISLAVMVPAAYAGRPMIIEDAAIVDAKTCQLETWIQKNTSSTEYWALPACNFSGNLEIAFGGAGITSPQGIQSAVVLQGKTIFKPLETNGWGAGLVFGNQSNAGRGFVGDLYANIPVSVSFQDNRVLLHANLGWLRGRETRRYALTWGVGSELQLTHRTTFIAETYVQNGGRPFFQMGVRHWLVPNHVQLDASYGSRFNSSEDQFYSIGVVLFTDAILP